MEEEKKSNKKVFIIIAIIALAIIVIMVFVNKNKSIKPQYDNQGNPIYISNTEVNNIFTSADPYIGKFVDFTGKILSTPETLNGTVSFQVYTDPKNYTNTIIVYCSQNIITEELKADDFVKLTGYVGGTYTGQNALNMTIINPMIIGTKVEKSTYKDVVMPTIKEVNYENKIIDQNGYVIEIKKVEFAKEETRIYVKAINNAKSDFSLYSFNSKIIQGNKQYDEESNYDANYPEIQSDIKPGITSEGVLCFKAIDQNNFTLIIEGSSDDYSIDLKDYTYNLDIE